MHSILMPTLSPPSPRSSRKVHSVSLNVELTAVIAAATSAEPRVLTLRTGRDEPDSLPSGPLAADHRTLEAGLRAWVEQQTEQKLGYVEQLYTFGDRDRLDAQAGGRSHVLSVAYLALVREARPAGLAAATWRSWYGYFPWEDWRQGRPGALDVIEPALKRWGGTGEQDLQRLRRERIELTFGFDSGAWNDERVLERYELLFEAGLVPETSRLDTSGPSKRVFAPGDPMMLDHRRMLATAIGRLRGKIKYRPVIFELMPPAFTLLELQRTVEALSGVRLHKQNFRRLVESQGLVEETGEVTTETGGRPARLVRFRREVLHERLAPGVRLAGARRATLP
jgi:hypothetical protein